MASTGIQSLSGNDALILDGTLITDLADNDNFSLEFPNDMAAVKTGKSGNAIFAANEMGRQGKATIRIIRGGRDDKRLLGRLRAQQRDFPGFVLITGTLSKEIGDGVGGRTRDQYLMEGGVFIKQTPAKSNSEGDTEQSLSIYEITFANVRRVNA